MNCIYFENIKLHMAPWICKSLFQNQFYAPWYLKQLDNNLKMNWIFLLHPEYQEN